MIDHSEKGVRTVDNEGKDRNAKEDLRGPYGMNP